MNADASPPQNDEFPSGLVVSLGAHVLLVALFVLRSVIFPADSYEAVPAIRVDIVGLPDKAQPLPPPADPLKPEGREAPPAKPAPQVESAPAPAAKPLPSKTDTDAINLDKSKAKQKEALNRLKSMQALDRIKEATARETAETERKRLEQLATEARARAGAAKVKGNVLAPGTSLVGIDKLQHEEYRGNLDRHIKPHWQLPEWLARKGLKALALVKIDGRGQVLSRQMVRTSGNPDFDANVLETIDRSAPLPPPPEKFVAKVATEGILLEFGEEGGNQ